MSRFSLVLVALAVAAAPALAQGTAPTTTIWAGVYTDEQAVQGARIYPSACSVCHGKALEGVPDEGIPPGTRWEDVPETWTCPDCGTTKDDFEMIEID